MPDDDPDGAGRRWRLSVQREVRAALAAEGLLLDPDALRDWRQSSDSEGAALFRRYLAGAGPGADALWQRACADLAIPLVALYRILGFGAAQTRALSGTARDQEGFAGALFNLGIVLFDALVDQGGDEAARARDFDGAALRKLAEGESRPVAGGGASFEFFLSVAAAFFGALGEDRRGRVHRRLPAMLSAETAPANGGGRLARWRRLRRKSVWPFLTLAETGGAPALARARAFGSCVWIVDDLWDAPEDWLSGSPSRAWTTATDEAKGRLGLADALSGLAAAGRLAAERRRLALGLRRFAATAPPAEARRCLGATLGAWINAA